MQHQQDYALSSRWNRRTLQEARGLGVVRALARPTLADHSLPLETADCVWIYQLGSAPN